MSRTLADLEWPRHTRRLLLRPATLDDARAIHDCKSLPEVCQWLSARPADWERFLADFERTSRRWLVAELGHRLIGAAKIAIGDGWAQAEVAERAHNTQAELGWLLHPDHFGRGYATEIARELLAICFEDLGLRRVHAGCFAENVASWKVMEKIGMRREGHYLRESLHRDGTWRDGLDYAMLAEEWVTGRDG